MRLIFFFFIICITTIAESQTIYGKIKWNNKWKDTVALTELNKMEDFFSGSNSLVKATTIIDTVSGCFEFKNLLLDTNIIYRLNVTRKHSCYGSISFKYPFNNYCFIKPGSLKDTVCIEANIDSLLVSSFYKKSNLVTMKIDYYNKYFIKQLGSSFFLKFTARDIKTISAYEQETFERLLIKKMKPLQLKYFSEANKEADFYVKSFAFFNYNAHAIPDNIKNELNLMFDFFQMNSKHSFSNSFFDYYSNLETGFRFPQIIIKDKEALNFDNSSKFKIVKFWATWCKPCLVELEELNSLLNKNKKLTDIEIYAINLDYSFETYKKFISMHQYHWNNFHLDNSFENEAIKKLKISSLPRNYFINKKGYVLNSDMSQKSISETIN